MNYYRLTYSGSDIPETLNLDELSASLRSLAPEIYCSFTAGSSPSEDYLTVLSVPDGVASSGIDSLVSLHTGSSEFLGIEEREIIIDGIVDVNIRSSKNNKWLLSKSFLFPGTRQVTRIKEAHLYYEIPSSIPSFSFRIVNSLTQETLLQVDDVSSGYLIKSKPTLPFPEEVTPMEIHVKASTSSNSWFGVDLRVHGLNLICFC